MLFLFRELLQSRSRDAVDGPFVHRHGTERLVKVDAGLVPVEADPLQAAAAAFHCDFRQLLQQPFAVPFATMLGTHEEVFQVDARAAHESGEVVKKSAKPTSVSPSIAKITSALCLSNIHSSKISGVATTSFNIFHSRPIP